MLTTRYLLLTAACGVFLACGPMAATPENQVTVPALAAPAADNNPILPGAVSGFGRTLLTRLATDQPQDNVFISPASIAAALTMAGNGAAGETRREMLATLGLDDLAAANLAYRQWLAETQHSDSGITIAIANSLWSHHTFSPGADFLVQLEQYFSAPMTTLDFHDPASADRINSWVGTATRDKIKNLVSPEILDNSVFCLINAIYFKGSWSTPFDPALTVPGNFTRGNGSVTSIPLMTRNGEFDYRADARGQAVRLPYSGGNYAMYVFLPAAGSSPRELLPELTGPLFDGFHAASGTLQLPRFKVEYEETLNDQLADMGMPLAFTARADFSPIAPGICISLVKHKAILEVNEQGSEAAAATLIAFRKTALERPFTMTVNRPFLVVIRDEGSGLLLFTGIINQPQTL